MCSSDLGVLPRLEAVESSLVPIYTGTEKPTADGPFLWLQVIQQGGDVDPDPENPDGKIEKEEAK